VRTCVIPPAHVRGGGLSAASRRRGVLFLLSRAGGIPGHDCPREPLGLPGRVTTGPHRRSGSLRGREAGDGGDRFLSPQRQGDDAGREPRPGA
jgi:hypothetical protein